MSYDPTMERRRNPKEKSHEKLAKGQGREEELKLESDFEEDNS